MLIRQLSNSSKTMVSPPNTCTEGFITLCMHALGNNVKLLRVPIETILISSERNNLSKLSAFADYLSFVLPLLTVAKTVLTVT